MRLEDNPGEFLFGGNFETSALFSQESFTPKYTFKLDLLHFILNLLYFINIVFVSYVLVSTQQLLSFDGTLLLLIFIHVTISILKSYILLKRYGHDLNSNKSKSINYITTQTWLSTLLLFFSAIGGYFLWNFINPDETMIFISTSILLLFLLYIKYFNGIGLVSAALGKGLLPSWGGIKTSLKNFHKITSFKGEKQGQLGFVTGLFLVASIVHSYLQESSIFIILAIILVTVLNTRWEAVNASSVLMSIRAIIQKMAPSYLRVQDFDESVPILSEPPNKFRKPNARDVIKQHGSLSLPKTKNKKILSQGAIDLSSLAAKSIKRIADKIRQETGYRESMAFCTGCGTEGISSKENCHKCNEEYARMTQTFGD